jgi:hypothetical protein
MIGLMANSQSVFASVVAGTSIIREPHQATGTWFLMEGGRDMISEGSILWP